MGRRADCVSGCDRYSLIQWGFTGKANAGFFPGLLLCPLRFISRGRWCKTESSDEKSLRGSQRCGHVGRASSFLFVLTRVVGTLYVATISRGLVRFVARRRWLRNARVRTECLGANVLMTPKVYDFAEIISIFSDSGFIHIEIQVKL